MASAKTRKPRTERPKPPIPIDNVADFGRWHEDPPPKPKDLGYWYPWIEWAQFPGLGKDKRADLRLHIYTERRWLRNCKQSKNQTGLDRWGLHGPCAVLHRDTDEPGDAEYPHDFHYLSVHRIRRFGLVLVIEFFPGGPWWNDPKRNLAIRPGSKFKGATHVDSAAAKGNGKPKRPARGKPKRVAKPE